MRFASAGNRTQISTLEVLYSTTKLQMHQGPTEIRTQITSFKGLCANHYTIRPLYTKWDSNPRVNYTSGLKSDALTARPFVHYISTTGIEPVT